MASWITITTRPHRDGDGHNDPLSRAKGNVGQSGEGQAAISRSIPPSHLSECQSSEGAGQHGVCAGVSLCTVTNKHDFLIQ